MSEFANWFAELFRRFLDWILQLVTDALDWVLELVEWIPKTIWKELLDAFASAIEAIPVPDFMNQAGSFFGDIPGEIVYFFQFFAVAEGVAMILSALVLRFLIRRIPIIG